MISHHDRRNLPTQIADCIEHTIPGEYIPHFKYYPILVNEYSKDLLKKINNVIAALFYIENSSPEELGKEIDEIVALLHEENKDELNVFGNWFNNYLSYIEGNPEMELTWKIESIMEVKSMFATKMKEHDAKLLEKGIEQGLEKGIEQGLEKGIEQGLEKGEVLGIEKEKIQVTRRMLKDGMEKEKIALYTGLSLHEIDEISKNMTE